MTPLLHLVLLASGGYRFRDPGSVLPALAAPEGVVPEWIHVVPYGEWRGHAAGKFRLDASSAARILANFTTLGRDLVIDYEHQTMTAPENGQPAPAAGWIDRLELRADGVWGHVRWTDKAAAHIAAREYRFVSPVLFWHWPDPVSGADRGTALGPVALTNTPFLSELTPVASRTPRTPSSGDSSMLTLLLTAFGLPDDATEEAATAAVADGKALRTAACKAAGVADDASVADVTAGLVRVARHDGYVPVEVHTAALREAVAARSELTDEALLTAATDKGLVTPATATWAREYVKNDRVGFLRWAEVTPAIIPLRSPMHRNPVDSGSAALTGLDEAVCRQLGLDQKQFKEARK